MNIPASGGVECSVERGELLPPVTGGAETLCSDIREAAAELGAPAAQVTVRVLSPYALAAVVTVGGRTLPELKLARSDRELGRDSLRSFAQSIASAANTSQ